MTELEFLQELRKALENDLDEQAVRENVRYYREYIASEKKKGISEERILEDLGDPWAIARNITGSPGGYQSTGCRMEEETKNSCREDGNGYRTGDNDAGISEAEAEKEMRRLQRSMRWRLWLFLIFLILMIAGIISVVTGLIRFFAPVLVPLLVALLIVRIWESRR